MFEKLVAIEPVSLIPSAEEELHRYAKEVVLYRDVPGSDAEMVRRIGDADAVLLSYTSRMGKEVIAQCPNIRYIGMCCSLYSEESANVDIAYARTRGIQVLGIRDYGDRGVVEYVLHELTGLLHGFGMPMLRNEPVEITGLKVGIVGLGVSGRMIAEALQFMGAEISYFARSAKPDAEAAFAVGGTWMCKSDVIKAGDWAKITAQSKEAVDTMLGLKLLHVGINTDNEEEAMKVANLIGSLLNMKVAPGNSSIFVGSKEFEIMKKPGRGTHGHIAIGCNNVDRAIYHLSQRGVKFDLDSKVVKNGKTIACYFADEIAGFAFHLVQA